MRDPLADARRSLAATRLLIRRSFFSDAVSRAYYAMFYAARAAVHSEGAEPKTHSGVASEFSRLFVQTGRVTAATAKMLRQFASLRAEADYEDRDLTAREANDAIHAAEQIIAAVASALGVMPAPKIGDGLTDDQKRDLVAQLTREMDAAAESLEFEKAAELRDSIAHIEAQLAA